MTYDVRVSQGPVRSLAVSRGLCPCLWDCSVLPVVPLSLPGRVGESRFRELRSSGIIKIASVKAPTFVGFEKMGKIIEVWRKTNFELSILSEAFFFFYPSLLGSLRDLGGSMSHESLSKEKGRKGDVPPGDLPTR